MTAPNDAVLDAFLALIAEKGFDAVSLRDVGHAANLGLADLYRQYPDKVALVAAFAGRVDAEVLAGTPREADPEETVRDRLFDTLMRRYDLLRPHRAALRAVRDSCRRDPVLALAVAPVWRRSMAAMLEAAGLDSDGLTGALRQGGLLFVQASVGQVFDGDDTGDLSKTMAALDSRLKSSERWAQLIDKYVKRPTDRVPGQDRQSPAP